MYGESRSLVREFKINPNFFRGKTWKSRKLECCRAF
jgi:hypothetical protein